MNVCGAFTSFRKRQHSCNDFWCIVTTRRSFKWVRTRLDTLLSRKDMERPGKTRNLRYIMIYIYYIYFRFCVIIRVQQVNTRIEHRLVYWWLWWIYSKLDSTLWSTSFSITGHSWKVLTAKRLGPKRSHQGSAHLFVPSATCLSPACILEGLIREWPGQIDRIGKRIEIFADNFWVSHIPGLIHN